MPYSFSAALRSSIVSTVLVLSFAKYVRYVGNYHLPDDTYLEWGGRTSCIICLVASWLSIPGGGLGIGPDSGMLKSVRCDVGHELLSG